MSHVLPYWLPPGRLVGLVGAAVTASIDPLSDVLAHTLSATHTVLTSVLIRTVTAVVWSLHHAGH